MPRYTYLCKSCDASFEEMRSIDNRDDMPPCPSCDTVKCVIRPIEAPLVMFNSYVDGQRKDMQHLKEAARLEVKAASMPEGAKKQEYKKEIDNLKKAKT